MSPRAPISEILRRELERRGWEEENGPNGRRKVNGWRHSDGEWARSLVDALVRQIVRDMKDTG